MPLEIVEAITDEEISACWQPLIELRPHLVQSQLVERVQNQRSEGYRLYCAKKGGNPEVLGIIGYRIQNYLFSGKTLYIDDLSTVQSARGQGIGGSLLDFVIEIGRKEKCDVITLDSGYTRNDAHRLYLKKMFEIKSIHFARREKILK